MGDRSATGSTVPRRRLGRELNRLRETKCVTVEHAAAEMDWSRNKIWRIEAGKTPVATMDVKNLCDLYEATPDLTTALMGLAKETKQTGWWHAYGDTIPDWFQVYVGMEAAASAVHEYSPEFVPGLLQTQGYMRTAIHAFGSGDTEEIERLVRVRAERQAVLTRKRPAAPELRFVINEAVIRRPVGGPAVMADQLSRLHYVSKLPNVTLRILPFAQGFHAGMGEAFHVLDFSSSQDSDIIYIETQVGALYLEKPHELERYRYIFDDVIRRSLDPERTRQMIGETLREYS